MITDFNKIDDTKRTKCEIWTRVMGYCRPVSNFNKGKKSEYRERKFFTEGASVGHCDCAFGAAAAA